MTPRSTDTRFACRTMPATVLLALLALLVYANTFNTPFLFDDQLNITRNLSFRNVKLTPEALVPVLSSQGSRPLASLSFAVNYYMHGYDVRGYHAVNLIIHLLTALLVFLIARSTLELCGMGGTPAPLLAAALWLVNPVHTQSVIYTVQRMNSLATLFYLLALFCYIRARLKAGSGNARIRRMLFYGLCLVAGLLGLAAKEIAATLPVMLFLYEWYFFQDLNRAWLKKRLPWIGLAVLLVAGLAFFYLGADPLDKILASYRKHDFTPAQRLLTEPAVVIYYISLLIYPHPGRLALIYDFPVFSSPAAPLAALAGILGLAALALAGVRLSKKQRLLSFAIFWFLGNLVIESSIFGLALVFEHRTYLPSVFPFIALTALALKPLRRRVIPMTVICLLILVCGYWTYQRNRVWNDAVGFWQDNVAKAPHVPEVNNNLGQALLVGQEPAAAVDYFRIAVKLDPAMEAARVNLGVALQRLGYPEQAGRQYQTVLSINPANNEARFNLAMQLKESGRTDAAITQLEEIITIDPRNTGAFLNLGIALMEQQQNETALIRLKQAADLDPSDSRILNNLGIVLHRLGKTAEAMTVFSRGLSLDPHNPVLHNSLGLLLMDRGRYKRAVEHFQMALAGDPELVEAVNNLGLASEKQGKRERAMNYYRQALALSPAFDLARYNLAALLVKNGQPGLAVSRLMEISTVKPEHRAIVNRLIVALAEANELGQAAILAEKMASAIPKDKLIYYNLACLYARLNDPEKALINLKKAVVLGYDRREFIKTDPDLENIRDTEYYKKLIQE